MSTVVMERRRFDAIDAARGGAAVIVLLEHALHACFPEYKAYSEAHFMVGEAAIFVFFMISGFVIPMSLDEGRAVGTFWLRRVFRLMPVYWLSIATAFLCFPLGLPSPSEVAADDWKSWFANVFLLQNPMKLPGVLGVYWSLYYEVGLYVVFSVLAATKLLNRVGIWVVGGFLLYRAVPTSSWMRGTPAVLTYHQAILMSVVFGYIAYRYYTGRFSRRTFVALTVAIFAVFPVRWSINHLSFPTTQPFEVVFRWMGTLALGAATFVGLMEMPGRWMPRVLVWLGRRSYPLYLLHPLGQTLVWTLGWPVWAFLSGAAALTILFSDLAHRFIERPSIRLGRWLEHRHRKQPVVVDAKPVLMDVLKAA